MSEPQVTIYPARLVRTMDSARPTAEAVAVVGDRIRAVGTVDELARYGTARVDDRFADAVLLPGFVEAHAHVMGGGMWRHTYVGRFERIGPDGRRWPGCADVPAVLERLREASAALPDPHQPLLAWGLDPIHLAGERLDRRHLDRVSSTRPIFVMHQSFHIATVNSAVLDADRITRDCPVEGVVKDADGEPTGELLEPPAMALAASVPPLLELGFDEAALRSFGADARNHGITTLVDLGSTALMDDDAVRGFRRVVDAPDFPARLSVFHMGAGLAESVRPSDAVGRLIELRATSSPKLRFGHVKLVLDGSIQGFTARLQEPGYLDPTRRGIWLFPPETFAETFAVFHRAGLTVHVHCNGDEATELFLDTVESTLAAHPRWDHRHTVTHSQLTTAAQYRRMAALGMCANIFSNHIWHWGDQHRDLILGPDRARRMNAAATALRAGVPITLHSDSPVTPLGALATMSHACTRLTPSGDVLGEQERISVPEALHAMTLGAAHTLKLDHLVGSLEAGKYADLAVLDEDPLEVEPVRLRDIRVRGSVVGGTPFESAVS
jgi:predicted amidohydrolase YtcJ